MPPRRTCRPYAYAEPAWRIAGFAEAGLADFGPGQVRRFVERWFGRPRIRETLERLAFEVHATQTGVHGTADIPASRLTHELVCAVPREEERPDTRALDDYLRQRVGILYQRAGTSERDAVYAFPHRSFQEFLAAAHLGREERGLFDRYPESGCDTWPDLAAWLARRDPDRWREVVLLAGGLHAGTAPGTAWNLVDALYPALSPPALLAADSPSLLAGEGRGGGSHPPPRPPCSRPKTPGACASPPRSSPSACPASA